MAAPRSREGFAAITGQFLDGNMRNRFDETWHRLREWTQGQTPSERLAAQILINEGFADVDPSHPLGGKDGGKDAIAKKDSKRFAMAVYFPRGQQSLGKITEKFEGDLAGARSNSVEGFAFVTNQELTLGERETLKDLAQPIVVELYHLERITTILDSPPMAKVREQFLDIQADSSPTVNLGGEGGAAPGAGGGGGAGIGPRACGGRGGDGGKFHYFGPDPVPLDVIERTLREARDGGDLPPGAGGGGGGAIGKGAVGGDGGTGGDGVRAAVPVTPGDILEIEVGQGGKASTLPGQHPGSGSDSVVRIRSPDGTVKGTIRAEGGRGARAGNLPEGVAEISQADLDGGFEISSLMLANVFELRDGCVYMLGGGWATFNVPQLPLDTTWAFLCTASWRALDSTAPRGVQICLLDPHRTEVSRIALVLPLEASRGTNYHWTRVIGAPLNREGRWLIRAQSGEFLLSQIEVNVMLTP